MADHLKGTFRVVRSFAGPAGRGVEGDIVTDPPAYYGPFVEKVKAKPKAKPKAETPKMATKHRAQQHRSRRGG